MMDDSDQKDDDEMPSSSMNAQYLDYMKLTR